MLMLVLVLIMMRLQKFSDSEENSSPICIENFFSKLLYTYRDIVLIAGRFLLASFCSI